MLNRVNVLIILIEFGLSAAADSPFECSPYICPSYLKENSECDLLCMSPACNYDSSDFKSKDSKGRFLSSGCLAECLDKGCSLPLLADKKCDSSCNIQQCGFDLGDCGYCAAGCLQNYTAAAGDDMLTNNKKDTSCNTPACMYDNGQYGWCASDCFQTDLQSSTLKESCNNSACNYQDLKNSKFFCNPGCSPELQEDAFCQEVCNKAACNYDSFKCLCNDGCTDEKLASKTCQTECNNVKCGYQGGVCGDCASGCFWAMTGDGKCDSACNVESCGYDYGDCQCAPGCSTWYNKATASWTWEQGCNEKCLVEDCLFNYGGCSDDFLIRASFYYALLNNDPEATFKTSICTNSNPKCTESQLRNSDSSKVPSPNCASSKCLYSMGLTVSKSDCTRVKESSGSDCFQCKSAPQVSTTCLASSDCPAGFKSYSELYNIFNKTTVCLKEAEFSHKNNYFIINLTPSGTSETILADAFMKTTRKYVKILLSPGNYYYGKATSVNEIFNLPLSPLGTSVNLNIKEIVIEGDKNNWPVIFLTQNVMKIHTSAKSLVIRYVTINGSLSLMKTCNIQSCTYCPYTINIYKNLFINDRSVIIDTSNYPSTCSSFTSSSFISINAGNSLTLSDVSIMNFQQQYSSFIYSEGSVSLSNVEFNKIQSWDSFITLSGSSSSLTFTKGKVSNLNFGYEFRADIIQSGFLAAENSGSIKLSQVDFESNFVLVGSSQSATRSLLQTTDVTGQVSISDCSFSKSFLYRLLSFDSSNVAYSSFTIDKHGNFDKYSEFHLTVEKSRFENLGVFDCVLCVKMSDVVQNVFISNLNFSKVFNGDSGVVVVSNEGSFGSEEIDGVWTYAAGILGFVQSRKVQIVDCRFEFLYYSGNVFEISNFPEVYMNNLQFQHLSQSEPKYFTEKVLIPALNGGYFSEYMDSNSLEVQNCGKLVFLDSIEKITQIGIKVQNISCPTGSNFYINNVDSVSLSDLTFSQVSDNSTNQLLYLGLVTELKISSIYLNNIIKNFNIIEMYSCESVAINSFTGLNLFSNFKSTIQIDSSSSISISDLRCETCTTARGNGAILNIYASTSDSKIIIERFAAVGCNADSGFASGIYLDSSTTNSKHVFSVTDFSMEGSAANDGTAVTISNGLNFDNSSALTKFTITKCSSTSGGIISDSHQKGRLQMSNFIVSKTSGFYSFLKSFYIENSTVLVLSSIELRDLTTESSVIYISSIHSSCEVLMSNLSISSNRKTSKGITVVSAKLIIDSIYIDSGLGIDASLKSNLYIKNLKFSGLSGIGILLFSYSVLTCNNCSFDSITVGSAIQVEDGGNFTVNSGSFKNLHSSMHSVALIVLSDSSVSYFNDCLFESITTSMVGHSIETLWGNLEVNNSKIIINSDDSNGGIFRLLNSSLKLNNVKFENNIGKQVDLMSSSAKSTITIQGSDFSSGASSSNPFLSLIETDISIKSSNFTNCLNSDENSGAFHITVNSNMQLDSVVFSVNSSEIDKIGIYFAGDELRVTNSNFTVVASSSKYRIFYLAYGKTFFMNNSQLAGSGCIGVKSKYQDSIEIKNSGFSTLAPALFLEGWNANNNHSVAGCQFTNNANFNGGSALLESVKISFYSCYFFNNSADKGGALFFASALTSNLFTVSDSVFEKNSAVSQGGAIYWQDFEPTLQNVSYKNNSANYGSDSGSIPKKISFDLKPSFRELTSTSFECVPGSECTSFDFRIYVLDVSGNLYSVDNSSKVILSTDLNYSVLGDTIFTADQGVFYIKGLSFSGKPGTNFTVFLQTSSLDTSATLLEPQSEDDTKLNLTVNFRKCTYGEAESDTSCTVCSKKTYLIESDSNCNDCKNHATCYGGFKIVPNAGYWKSSNFSDVIYKCPLEEACLGYQEDKDDYSGSCSYGYKGKKCFACIDGYTKVGSSKCGKCPSKISNIFILICLLLINIGFGFFLVRVTLKSAYSSKSLHSIYVKIFTNYIQLVFLTTQFDLAWPSYVLSFFQVQSTVATAYDQIYSFDCYFSDSGYSFEEIYYYKLIFNAFLPIIIWLFSLIIHSIVSYAKEDYSILKQEYFMSMTVLFFLIYPNLVKTFFSSLSCTHIDGEGDWLRDNLIIKCWQSTHLKYSLIVAIPGICIWTLGIPVLVLVWMIKKRNYLSSHFNKVVFGFLYNGYKSSRFYWEFVIMFRKIFIICIAVFMQELGESVQALTLVVILMASLSLQYEYKPFNKKQLNHMEFEAVLTACLTIYCGLYYLTNEIGEGFKSFLFFIIVAGNGYFLIYWLYYMTSALLDVISDFIPAVRKITGKLDPYPEIVNFEPIMREGSYKNPEDEELLFTVLPKPRLNPPQVRLPGISSMKDLVRLATERAISKRLQNPGDIEENLQTFQSINSISED